MTYPDTIDKADANYARTREAARALMQEWAMEDAARETRRVVIDLTDKARKSDTYNNGGK